MRLVEPLLPIALLGTERAGDVAAALRAIGGVAAPLLEAVAGQRSTEDGGAGGTDAPTTLLRAAGVLAQCQRVGFLVAPGGDLTASDAGDPATDPPALGSPGWLRRLAWVLSEGPAALQHDALHTLAQRGYRLHAQLLPAALDLAVNEPRLREVIGRAVGARGHWLARQRACWIDALGGPAAPTEDEWSHGRLPARVAYLRHERSRAPDVARERLQAELGQMGAQERAELVACLAVGVGPADEALLEALLVDRAVEVRRTAARLLVRLPGSARSMAICSALAALVGKNKKGAWKIDAPEGEPARAKALGLEPLPKVHQLGERAFSLLQLARNAPVGFWTAHTGMSPPEVIAWAARSEWSEAVLRGIHDALIAAPDLEWARALLAGWNAKALGEDTSAIHDLLPWAEREALWQARLASGRGSGLVEIAQEIAAVASPTDRLSPDLAALFVKHAGTDASGFGEFEHDDAVALVAAMPDAALEALRHMRRGEDPMMELDDTQAAIENVIDVRLRLPRIPVATGPASARAAPSAASDSPPADSPRTS